MGTFCILSIKFLTFVHDYQVALYSIAMPYAAFWRILVNMIFKSFFRFSSHTPGKMDMKTRGSLGDLEWLANCQGYRTETQLLSEKDWSAQFWLQIPILIRWPAYYTTAVPILYVLLTIKCMFFCVVLGIKSRASKKPGPHWATYHGLLPPTFTFYLKTGLTKFPWTCDPLPVVRMQMWASRPGLRMLLNVCCVTHRNSSRTREACG